MTTRLRAAALVMACGAVLVACGGPAPGDAGLRPDASTSSHADGPRAGVPEQLRFTATTLDGAEFSGERLAGKPAVLWFWAPWCAICQHEAPFIARMAKEHGDEATFVGVAALDDVPAMREFADRFGFDAFTNLNDEKSAVWARFGVTAQPAFAFISASGEVEVVKGTVTEQDVVRWLETRAQS